MRHCTRSAASGCFRPHLQNLLLQHVPLLLDLAPCVLLLLDSADPACDCTHQRVTCHARATKRTHAARYKPTPPPPHTHLSLSAWLLTAAISSSLVFSSICRWLFSVSSWLLVLICSSSSCCSRGVFWLKVSFSLCAAQRSGEARINITPNPKPNHNPKPLTFLRLLLQCVCVCVCVCRCQKTLG
jgi:hypothetical protein